MTTTTPHNTRAHLRAAVQTLADAALVLLSVVPFVAGLIAGLLVSLALWWLAAAMDGYRRGRVG